MLAARGQVRRLGRSERTRNRWVHANMRLRTRYGVELTFDRYVELSEQFRKGQVEGARRNHIGDLEGWVEVQDGVLACAYWHARDGQIGTFFAPPPPRLEADLEAALRVKLVTEIRQEVGATYTVRLNALQKRERHVENEERRIANERAALGRLRNAEPIPSQPVSVPTPAVKVHPSPQVRSKDDLLRWFKQRLSDICQAFKETGDIRTFICHVLALHSMPGKGKVRSGDLEAMLAGRIDQDNSLFYLDEKFQSRTNCLHGGSVDVKDIRYMSIDELARLGILQAINLEILHPLGLALERRIDENGVSNLGGVQDWRDDPEGMTYEKVDMDKRETYLAFAASRHAARQERLGYVVQPAIRTKEEK